MERLLLVELHYVLQESPHDRICASFVCAGYWIGLGVLFSKLSYNDLKDPVTPFLGHLRARCCRLSLSYTAEPRVLEVRSSPSTRTARAAAGGRGESKSGAARPAGAHSGAPRPAGGTRHPTRCSATMARRPDPHRWRPTLLALLAAVGAAAVAADGDVTKEKTTPAVKKLEKSFLLEARVPPLTCPPPEVFYESCHMSREYVEYRRRHSQGQFEHERHFRPVIGPPQPRPLPHPQPAPRPLPQPLPRPRNPTLVTFVAEEAHPVRRDPWYEPGYDRGRGPPARRPDWDGAAERDRHAWRESK